MYPINSYAFDRPCTFPEFQDQQSLNEPWLLSRDIFYRQHRLLTQPQQLLRRPTRLASLLCAATVANPLQMASRESTQRRDLNQSHLKVVYYLKA
jgi:hypothetical protein